MSSISVQEKTAVHTPPIPDVQSIARSIVHESSQETWVRFSALPDGMSIRVSGVDAQQMPIREVFTEHTMSQTELLALLEKLLQECTHSV